MDEKEKKEMKEAIEKATEEIHQLFIHNGWKWGGLSSDPEYTPSEEEIKKTIEELVSSILDERKDCESLAEGMIEVRKYADGFVDIGLDLHCGHFFLRKRKK